VVESQYSEMMLQVLFFVTTGDNDWTNMLISGMRSSSSSIFPGLFFFTTFYLGYSQDFPACFLFAVANLLCLPLQSCVCAPQSQHFGHNPLLWGLGWAKAGSAGGHLPRGAASTEVAHSISWNWEILFTGPHIRLPEENNDSNGAVSGSSESTNLTQEIWEDRST
jgi:hypothetical protein